MFRSVLLCVLVAVAAGAAPKVRPLVPMLDGRIVGGEEVKIEDYPYQVSLQQYGYHICGGSIINNNTIVTAAHCTYGLPDLTTPHIYRSSASLLSVRVGTSTVQTGGQVLLVERIIEHDNFNGQIADYDVSILKLASPIVFEKGVQPIAIQEANSEVADGTSSTVSGWGTTSPGGSVPNNLRAVSVPIVGRDDCNVAYDGKITARMICAGLGDKDSCQGDSGGPLVANGNLVGVVSWGYGCADPRYPGVYTNVANKEIHEHIKNYW